MTNNHRRKVKIFSFGGLTIFLILVDQFLKQLMYECPILECFYDFLCLELYKNERFYFGLLGSDNIIFFIVIDLFLILAFFYLIHQYINLDSIASNLFLVLSLSGFISNGLDKYFNGFVIDYLCIKLVNKPFGHFNFADIYIYIGILFFLRLFLREQLK